MAKTTKRRPSPLLGLVNTREKAARKHAAAKPNPASGGDGGGAGASASHGGVGANAMHADAARHLDAIRDDAAEELAARIRRERKRALTAALRGEPITPTAQRDGLALGVLMHQNAAVVISPVGEKVAALLRQPAPREPLAAAPGRERIAAHIAEARNRMAGEE